MMELVNRIRVSRAFNTGEHIYISIMVERPVEIVVGNAAAGTNVSVGRVTRGGYFGWD
jgi:hypothetical protein